MNGCCFGGPSDVICAITFPYGSPPYQTQVKPDPGRNRTEPRFDLPAEYFGYFDSADGSTWSSVSEVDKYRAYLKPKELLTDDQKLAVKTEHRAVGIHPTQLYSSANAIMLCLILYTFWRKFGIHRPGCTLGLMFMLYGPLRFLLEPLIEAFAIPMSEFASGEVTQPLMTLAGYQAGISICYEDSFGSEVAAAHAGWRGLCAGVLEETVARLAAKPQSLLAWLGPAISQAAFEVGPEVRAKFLARDQAAAGSFVSNERGRWQADLYELARLRLQQAGVTRVYGGDRCTFAEPACFFSYRRDGPCGRMATFIFRKSA